MYQLKNEHLQISVHPAGAELHSIISVPGRKEYLWQGDAAFWNRRSPVLFPFVGRLKNNSYRYNRKSYAMPQHGFARDLLFSIHEQTSDRLHFMTESNENTLESYPFPFRLEITHMLHEQSITCTWKVTNTGSSDMYFSIGAHPGFICPLTDEESLSDYVLEFNADETAERHMLTEGLYNGLTEPVFHTPRNIRLNEDLFLKDAIVLKHITSSAVTLRNKSGEACLSMDFSGFPYLGIWKKPGGRFICIEPWYGLADHVQHTGDLEQKEGILTLQAQTVFEASYTIHINH